MFLQIIRLREETAKMLEEQRQKEAQRVQRIWQQAGTWWQRTALIGNQKCISRILQLKVLHWHPVWDKKIFYANGEANYFFFFISLSMMGLINAVSRVAQFRQKTNPVNFICHRRINQLFAFSYCQTIVFILAHKNELLVNLVSSHNTKAATAVAAHTGVCTLLLFT